MAKSGLSWAFGPRTAGSGSQLTLQTCTIIKPPLDFSTQWVFKLSITFYCRLSCPASFQLTTTSLRSYRWKKKVMPRPLPRLYALMTSPPLKLMRVAQSGLNCWNFNMLLKQVRQVSLQPNLSLNVRLTIAQSSLTHRAPLETQKVWSFHMLI